MAGSILCAKRGCGAARNELICPKCGYPTVYIDLYWKSKRYYFRKDKDGKPFVDYRTARDFLSAMHVEMNRGRFNPADWISQKFEECRFENKIKEWIAQKSEEAAGGELSFETIKDYKGYAENHFHFLKGWDVREIRFEQLENFKDRLPKKLKIKTRRNVLNGLHAFFSWLKRKGTIQDIPAWPVIKGNDSDTRTAIDYDTQIYALEKIPEQHRDVIEFGFETGLRPGETCAVQIRDFESGVLIVQRTWSGSRLRETTKGGNKERVPLSQRASELFMKHSKGKFPNAFLFINPETNQAYRPKKLNQLWRAFTGIDITHYEASRHSFCTQIIENADVFSAQRLMRHKNLTSTKAYHHASIKRLEDIVNNRGRIVALESVSKRIQSEK